MGLNLTKGGNLNLSKESGGATEFTFGLGWTENTNNGHDWDLDASVICLGTNDKVLDGDAKYFVYFNNLQTPCGGVVHSGDERTGRTVGIDEVVAVDVSKLNPGVKRLLFVVTIHDAVARNQNFGQVRDAVITVTDTKSGAELCKYDLTENFSVETAVTFGELYNKDGEWKFKAIGAGKTGGLAGYETEFF